MNTEEKNLETLGAFVISKSSAVSLNDKINDFVFDSINEWEKLKTDSNKGLSDYVTNRMLLSLLENRDFLAYTSVLDNLNSL